jgi:CHAD domain-containing protein
VALGNPNDRKPFSPRPQQEVDRRMALHDKLAALASVTTRDAPERDFRLRSDEYVPDGVRRIARGRLADARDTLDGASRRSLDGAVHDARKDLKRLRTTLRLARDAIADETYERESAAYRAAGHRLGASRDAHVRVQTLGALTAQFAEELEPRVTAGLHARLVEEHERVVARLRDDDADVQAVLAELDDALVRIPAWTLESGDFTALSPALRRIYRRGRKRMRVARRDPSAATFHEWRKRVKDLRYAMQIVRVARPTRTKRIGRDAHELADLLGDDHDLAELREYAETHPQCFDDAASLQALLSIIDRRSARLRAQALARGARVYRRSPKRFTRDIERGWRKHASSDPRPVAG